MRDTKSVCPSKAKADESVDNTFLNHHYGRKGLVFEASKNRTMKATKKAAEKYQRQLAKKNYKESYITPLFDYKPSDIYNDGTTARVVEGAKPKYYGYLVTVLNNNI